LYTVLDFDLSLFNILVLINLLGSAASIVQHLITVRFKNNVEFEVWNTLYLGSVIAVGVINWIVSHPSDYNDLMTKACKPVIDFSEDQILLTNRMFTTGSPLPGTFDLKMVLTIIMIQCGIKIFDQMRKIPGLGDIIVLLTYIMRESVVFLGAMFGMFLIYYFNVLLLQGEILKDEAGWLRTFTILFDTLVGQSKMSTFTAPFGLVFLNSFMFIFTIFFMSLLVAMFINKFDRVSKDLEAIKRFEVIQYKNSVAYDK
jgi:hypothetical protein